MKIKCINKILLIVGIFVLVGCSNNKKDTIQQPNNTINKDNQYKELITNYNKTKTKEVIYFFSFNCPSCYKTDVKLHLANKISASLPSGVKLKKYHHETFKALAKELAQAWAIANVLHIEDQISDLIYEKNINKKALKSEQDIKNIFATVGVSFNQFEHMKKDSRVIKFMHEQHKSQVVLNPTYIPTIYVNGKYFINSGNLNKSSDQALVNDYIRVINYLVNK